MVLFVGLIIPMPFAAKRKLFNFISESPIVAKVQYAMKACGSSRLSLPPETNNLPDYLHFHPHPVSRQRQSSLPCPGRDVCSYERYQRCRVSPRKIITWMWLTQTGE